MSDFGVPHGEMSDSFSPGEGPDPSVGQDLEGLLSGEYCSVPESMRSVIPALDALRAAPVRSELLGEEAARAYFRTIMLGGQSEPAQQNEGVGEAHTLILPTETSSGEPHVVRRRHRHRRPPLRGRRQAKVLAGAAAGVLIAGAAVLASTLSSSSGHPAVVGHSHQAASVQTPVTASGSNGVDGSGKPEPTSNPSLQTKPAQQSANPPSPTELCREYSDFFTNRGRYVSQATADKIFWQLSSLAGADSGVEYYCMRLLQPWIVPQGSGRLPDMSGNLPGALPGAQGAQGGDSAPGQGGAGNGQDGNSSGSSAKSSGG